MKPFVKLRITRFPQNKILLSDTLQTNKFVSDVNNDIETHSSFRITGHLFAIHELVTYPTT